MRCGTAKGAEYSRAVTLAGRAANSVDLPGRCSRKVGAVVSSPAPDSRLDAHSASGRGSGGGGDGEVVVELRDMTPVDGRQRKEITRTVGEMWEEIMPWACRRVAARTEVEGARSQPAGPSSGHSPAGWIIDDSERLQHLD